jgi:sensor histidine kinase YesM
MKKSTTIQLIFWLLLIGINVVVLTVIVPFSKLLGPTFNTMIFTAVVLYGNSLYLFPKFYSSKSNRKFFWVSFIMIIVLGVLFAFIDFHLMKGFEFRRPQQFKYPFIPVLAKSIFWLSLIQLISTIYLLQKYLQKKSEETKQIIEEKLSTELKYLKAQINPHFLFNALNNIYSLAYLKSNRAPEGILRLSSMLRYVLDDCQADHVQLDSEIQYIESYIDFQQMKSPEPQNIVFEYNLADRKLMLAPMLLIPFIENSFKYSKVESVKKAFVDIVIKSDQRSIYFYVKNSIPEVGRVEPGSGKGIENVKHRLNILYPERHRLLIDERLNEFEVTLRIDYQ